MKKKILLNLTAQLCLSLAILLSFNLVAFAQKGATVKGKITKDNQPISDATVILKTLKSSEKLTTNTDSQGNYSFENVPVSNYVITAQSAFSGSGRVLSASRNIVLNVGETNLNLELNEEAIAIREVVVIIASGTDQPIDEVSKSVSVVSNEELQNRNEITIADALRTVPGLRVQQSGGFGRVATIKIRGLRNQDTAVLIDGQRFRDPSAITGDASPFLSDLQTINVEGIEVLRGSGSSLYGTNAIGGVFDVKTDNFQKGFRGSLLAEGGGLGEFRGRASFGGDLGEKAFYNLGLSHTNFSKGVDGDDAARNTSGKASAQFNFSNYANLTGRFYFSDAFVGLNSNPDTLGDLPAAGIVEARPLSRSEIRRYERGTPLSQINRGDATFISDLNDPDASQSSRFYNFNLVLDGSLNNFATYKVSYQNLQTRRRNLNGTAGFGFQPFDGTEKSVFSGNVQTINAKSDVAVKSNLITVGYEFEREKYGNDNFAGTLTNPVDSTDAAQRSQSIFAQDLLEAFDKRLQLSGAFRAQFFSFERPRFSANSPVQNVALNNPPAAYTADGSAAYFFRATGTKLRAHVGNGYRVPSLYERFGTFYDTFSQPNQFVLFGDFDLKPERSIAFDAGVDQTFSSHRVRLSATYFYTKLIETIGFENVVRDTGGTPRFFGGYLNTKGGIARGGEFSAEFKPFAATDVFASYTFTNSDQRQPQVSGSGILQTLGVPHHQFSTVVTQRLFDRLTLNFDFVATSSYLAPIFSNTSFQTRIYRFAGNRKGDLTASYEIPTNNDKLKLKLFGTIENVFNQDYYENGFRTARIVGRAGISLSF
ncbi:MAG: TonB-dependent receptor [Pyrinomonadaceae bacterium]